VLDEHGYVAITVIKLGRDQSRQRGYLIEFLPLSDMT